MVVLTLVTFLVGTLSIWVLKHWWTNRNFYYLARAIPQVEGTWPLLGHLPFNVGQTPQQQFLINCTHARPGPSPRKYWLGNVLFVVIDDPEQLQKVLTSKYCVDKPFYYDGLYFKKGLLVANGNMWRTHRRLCDPAFNLNILKSFLTIFNDKTKILLKILDEKVGGPEFDIYESMAPYALDNIIATSMGIKTDAQTNKDNEFLTHCYEGLRVTVAKVTNLWLQIGFIYRMTEMYKVEQKHIVNGFMKIANEVILQKEKDSESGVLKESAEPGTPQVFIDQLFKKRDILSNDEISDEVNTIIGTGFETISNTLSMITLLMAFFPDVQEKLFKELQEVYNSQDEEVSDEKLEQLPYMSLVIKEAMRFWPPVGFLGRHVEKNIQIGERTVPAGATLFLPIIQVHQDKRIWGEDADKFRPERFMKEEYSKIPRYAYLPFSRGTRNCIGYKYAMKSMKVALSYLFRQYKVTTSMDINEIEFDYLIISKISQGCRVSLHKRDFQSR